MSLPMKSILVLTADPTIAGFASVVAGGAGVNCVVTRDPDHLGFKSFRGCPVLIGADLAPLAAILIDALPDHQGVDHLDHFALVTNGHGIDSDDVGRALTCAVKASFHVSICDHVTDLGPAHLAPMIDWVRDRLPTD
jgi:hypothetical protein